MPVVLRQWDVEQLTGLEGRRRAGSRPADGAPGQERARRPPRGRTPPRPHVGLNTPSLTLRAPAQRETPEDPLRWWCAKPSVPAAALDPSTMLRDGPPCPRHSDAGKPRRTAVGLPPSLPACRGVHVVRGDGTRRRRTRRRPRRRAWRPDGLPVTAGARRAIDSPRASPVPTLRTRSRRRPGLPRTVPLQPTVVARRVDPRPSSRRADLVLLARAPLGRRRRGRGRRSLRRVILPPPRPAGGRGPGGRGD